MGCIMNMEYRCKQTDQHQSLLLFRKFIIVGLAYPSHRPTPNASRIMVSIETRISEAYFTDHKNENSLLQNLRVERCSVSSTGD
jgi:hypothetical protein